MRAPVISDTHPEEPKAGVTPTGGEFLTACHPLS